MWYASLDREVNSVLVRVTKVTSGFRVILKCFQFVPHVCVKTRPAVLKFCVIFLYHISLNQFVDFSFNSLAARVIIEMG